MATQTSLIGHDSSVSVACLSARGGDDLRRSDGVREHRDMTRAEPFEVHRAR